MLNELSDQLRWMVSVLVEMRGNLKAKEREFQLMVVSSELAAFHKSQAVIMVYSFLSETSQLRKLIRHYQRIINRLKESDEDDTKLMEDTLKDRLETLETDIENFQELMFAKLSLATHRIRDAEDGEYVVLHNSIMQNSV